MKKCPGCEYLVPEDWNECRRCGEELDSGPTTGSPAAVAHEENALAVAPAPPPAPAPAPSPAPPPAPAPAPAPSPALSPAPSALAGPARLTVAPDAVAPASVLSTIATLDARPALPDPVGAVAGDVSPAAPVSSIDEFFAPAKGAKIHTASTSPSLSTRVARLPRGVVIGAIAIALAVGWWTIVRDGGSRDGTEQSEAGSEPSFEILGEMGADGSLPSLGDVSRVVAESTLNRATMIAYAAYAETGSYTVLDSAGLAAYDPAIQWASGAAASTNSDTVSLSVAGPAAITLAVHAGEGLCAVMRDDGSGPRNVTIRTDLPCAAATVPAAVFAAPLALG